MLEHFLNLPVCVQTEMGEVIGILVSAEVNEYGEVGVLVVRGFVGDRWAVIKSWIVVKSGRSST